MFTSGVSQLGVREKTSGPSLHATVLCVVKGMKHMREREGGEGRKKKEVEENERSERLWSFPGHTLVTQRHPHTLGPTS